MEKTKEDKTLDLPQEGEKTDKIIILTEAHPAHVAWLGYQLHRNKLDQKLVDNAEVRWVRRNENVPVGNIVNVLKELADRPYEGDGCRVLVIALSMLKNTQVDKIEKELHRLKTPFKHITWYYLKDERPVENACKQADVKAIHNPWVEKFPDEVADARAYLEYRLRDHLMGIQPRDEILKKLVVDCFTKPLFTFTAKDSEFQPNHLFVRTLEGLNESASKERLKKFEGLERPVISGKSEKIEKLKKQIVVMAKRNNSHVLLVGETGTGKEAAAYFLHEYSPRRTSKLVTVNCASLEKDRMESELFGHEKGAYTGAVQQKKGLVEVADKGTLFLDEFAEFTQDMQAKLLRFIQFGSFRRMGNAAEQNADVRVVVAVQPKYLKQMRDDLLHRFMGNIIMLPPLRELPDDIEVIAKNMSDRLYGEKIIYFDNNGNIVEEKVEHRHVREAWKDIEKDTKYPEKSTLLNHDWPGNSRELFGVIEKLMCEKQPLKESIEEFARYLKGHKVTTSTQNTLVDPRAKSGPPEATGDNKYRYYENGKIAFKEVDSLEGFVSLEKLELYYLLHTLGERGKFMPQRKDGNYIFSKNKQDIQRQLGLGTNSTTLNDKLTTLEDTLGNHLNEMHDLPEVVNLGDISKTPKKRKAPSRQSQKKQIKGST